MHFRLKANRDIFEGGLISLHPVVNYYHETIIGVYMRKFTVV